MPIPTKISTAKRTATNEFKWGAAFGILSTLAFIATYHLFARIPRMSDDAANDYSTQLDQLNLIPTSSMNVSARSLLSYSIYCAAVSTVFGIGNVAYKAWRKTKKLSDRYPKRTLANRHPVNIDTLLDQTMNKRLLKLSKTQQLEKVALFGAFIVPNFFYDFAYKDASGDAVKLLPDYGMSLYKGLNPQAGMIGFLMNFALNQWFFFSLISAAFTSYKLIQLKSKYYETDKKAGMKRAKSQLYRTFAVSFVSSLGFFFLALGDPDLKTYYRVLTPLSSAFVYGLSLNTEGSISVLKDLDRFWSWLVTWPKPFIDAHNTLNTCRGHVLGYALHNIREYFRELSYYLGRNPGYIDNNDLELEQKVIHRKITTRDLKAEVNKEIRNAATVENNATAQLRALIGQAREKLLDEQENKPISTADLWKHGRIRKPLTQLALIGPAGISIVLFAYYLLVNDQLSSDIYKYIGLSSNDAAARMISFCLFFPFVKVVLDSSYSKVSQLGAGIEHKIVELYHSYQDWHGKKTESGAKPAKFDYTDRFHPKTKKEAAFFVLSGGIFALQLAAFLVTPPSAGTVIHLLDKYGKLNDSTKFMAFWFTALFNSFGVASFLSYGKQKIMEYADGKWTLFRKSEDFFEAASALENSGRPPLDFSAFETIEAQTTTAASFGN